jgi:hypothetical protein
MKRFVKRSVLTLMAAAAFAVCAHADDLSLTLIPSSGVVAGPQGSTLGWGFTLTDTGPYYVLLTDSYVVVNQNIGTYTDYISNPSNFYVAGPNPESQTINSPWNQSALTGTGELDLYPTDSSGSFSGTLYVDYNLFTEDPNNPNFDPSSQVGDLFTFSDPVQVTITPEPASWFLMSLPLTLLMLFVWRRQAAALRS